MLGKIENNCVRYSIAHKNLPEVLRNMADYLERPQLPYIHPTDAPKAPLLKKSSYNKLKKVMEVSANRKKKKCPEYPKSQKLTKPLEALYKEFNIEPEFYS
jgi:hypothetical protein